MANANVDFFKCRSKNNKIVRFNELKILEKYEDKLYFIFGANEVNTKKRYYDDVKTLNEDFQELKKIKERLEKEPKEDKENRTNSIRRLELDSDK